MQSNKKAHLPLSPDITNGVGCVKYLYSAFNGLVTVLLYNSSSRAALQGFCQYPLPNRAESVGFFNTSKNRTILSFRTGWRPRL